MKSFDELFVVVPLRRIHTKNKNPVCLSFEKNILMKANVSELNYYCGNDVEVQMITESANTTGFQPNTVER